MESVSRCRTCGKALTDAAGPPGICSVCLSLADSATIDSSSRDAGAPVRQPTQDGHPQRIGPYRILKVLGQGGMGVVYLAEQEHPIRRQVALKVIKRGMDTSEVVARFESERQALAVMNHENIARVFDAGATDEGRPFFAMEYVPGVPLIEYCDQQRLSNADRLALFVKVCGAIQHAHQKGIIHRDLKPSNVLVTGDAGHAVPKVIDFGIAKATDRSAADETAFTQYGALVGTPEYMSPEQASMGAEEVDTRTDIYSLGVMLYELLVGVLPFEPDVLRRAGFGEILRIVREVEPPKPSTRVSTLGATAADLARRRNTDAPALSRQLRGDLDWIVLKAIEKDRARRYASASELAADIERHMTDEPVVASPPSPGYRLKKAVRRHRVAVLAGAAIVASLLVGLVTATTMYVQAQRARLEADRQRALAEHQTGVAQTMYARAETSRAEADKQRGVAVKQTGVAQEMYARSESARLDAETQRGIAEARSYASNIAAASALLKASRREEALGRLSLAPPALRGWEWNYLYAQFDMSLACLDGDGGSITSLQYTPDGARVIWTSTLGVVRAAARRGYRRVDLGIPKPASPESVIAITSDASRYVVAPWTSPLPVAPALFIYTPGKPPDRRPDAADVPNVRFYAAARTVGGYPVGVTPYRLPPEVPVPRRTLTVRSVAPGPPLASLVLPSLGVSAPTTLAAVPASSGIAADARALSLVRAGRGGIEFGQGLLLSRYGGTAGSVVSGVFSQDGRRAAFWSWDNVLTVWDVATGVRLAAQSGHTDGISRVVFDPEGTSVASASADGTIRVSPVAGGDPLVLKGHDGAVTSIAFSPDGRHLVSGGADRTVRVWDRLGRTTGVLRGHQLGVTAVAWSPDGRSIASGAADGFIRLWDVTGMRQRDVLEGHLARVAALAFSPDSRELASGSVDGWVRIWNANRQSLVRPDNTVAADHVTNLFAQSAGGNREITATETSGALLWWPIDAPARVTTLGGGSPGTTLRQRTTAVSALAITDDGRRAASATQDGVVRVWTLDSSGAATDLRRGPAPGSGSAGASPAPVTAGRSTSPTPLTAARSIAASIAANAARTVESVSISQDGSRVAARFQDQKLILWSVDGKSQFEIDPGAGEILGTTFSPDGRRLAAGVERSLRIWDTATGRLVHSIEVSSAAVLPTTFSRDGRWLAAGYRDERIRVFDAATGRLAATWLGSGLGTAIALAFNAAGTRVAAVYVGGSVVVWDTTAQQPLLQVDVPMAAEAAFADGDTRIRVRANDGSVTLLDGRPTYDYSADELVRRLFQECDSSAEVVERIRQDRTLTPALRTSAEARALARGDFADRQWAVAENLAGRAGQPVRDYRRALTYADTAAAMMPAHPQPIEARGMALYRLGRLEESVAAFRRAVELRGGPDLVDLAFLQMALVRLGRTEEADRLTAEMTGNLIRRSGIEGMQPDEQLWITELEAVRRGITKK